MKKTVITTIIATVITAAVAASLTGCSSTISISDNTSLETASVAAQQPKPETQMAANCSADALTAEPMPLIYTDLSDDNDYTEGWYHQDSDWTLNDQYGAESVEYSEPEEYTGPVTRSYIQDGYYTPDNQNGPEGIDVTANYQANDAVRRVFTVYGFTYDEGFTGYEVKSFTECDGTKFHEICIGNYSGMGDEVIGNYYVNDSNGEVMTFEGFHDVYGWSDANV